MDMVGFQAFVAINKMFLGSLPDKSYKSKMLSILQLFGREGNLSTFLLLCILVVPGECNSKGY